MLGGRGRELRTVRNFNTSWKTGWWRGEGEEPEPKGLGHSVVRKTRPGDVPVRIKIT